MLVSGTFWNKSTQAFQSLLGSLHMSTFELGNLAGLLDVWSGLELRSWISASSATARAQWGPTSRRRRRSYGQESLRSAKA